MSITQKAGVVILSSVNPGRVLLLYRERENDWTFPKGHVEAGESAEQTAVREAKEETGLDVVLFDGFEFPPLRYAYPEGGEVEVRMFLGRSADDAALAKEHAGDDAVWLALDDVAGRLSYDNIREQWLPMLPRVRDIVASLRT